ncbi:DUF721 domain-containing protein [Anaplasmataceae bacterium AB001_6]|nr:DUF721 domain-containing protein [Anaplasmataceae bacterium AB001_6]
MFQKCLQNVLSTVEVSFGKYNSELFYNWNDIVGESLSNLCQPHKIVFSDDEKAVLYVKSQDISSIRLRLSYMTDDMIKMINNHFKFCFISQIRII